MLKISKMIFQETHVYNLEKFHLQSEYEFQNNLLDIHKHGHSVKAPNISLKGYHNHIIDIQEYLRRVREVKGEPSATANATNSREVRREPQVNQQQQHEPLKHHEQQ